MANVILVQQGNRCFDPKKEEYYDPWKNHIWFCIEQLRKWNPTIPIYMLTDNHEIHARENFERFGVKHELFDDLPIRHDLDSLYYFSEDRNPLGRTSTMRFFYMEAAMKKYSLTDCFSFDNDVLVFTDLNRVGTIASNLYKRTAITCFNPSMMIFGMCYIKNDTAFRDIVDELWSHMTKDGEKCWLLDMELWGKISIEKGSDYVSHLPVWIDGRFSDYANLLGGIFDPITMSQFLGGCHNGNPPGFFQPHHYICHRLKENRYRFLREVDADGRKFLSVVNIENGDKAKLLSMHIHNKRLREFMS